MEISWRIFVEGGPSFVRSKYLRLAGLYDLERGPHSYWLKVGVVKLGVVKNDGHENPWLKTLGFLAIFV